ncbi:hypothetical protein [Clostridioides sp. ES-S-0001-03]|uniref:hypothetical protein n=1 Tax=Clostridioides sp. ES-S-0001-03 TaxID=2770771 RepID=UPI001D0CB5D9|nr:hypothetical protein [Clostridioides sp. ES-S-0001-03]
MHSKIVNTLEKLNINIGFQEYDNFLNDEEYIIFFIENEYDANFSDNENKSIVYSIKIEYWYKSLKNINKYIDIKDIFKKEKFIFLNSSDFIENEHYCKELKFKYEEVV